VGFGDGAADGETEARAAFGAGASRIDPVKAVKDAAVVFGGDSRPAIRYPESDAVRVRLAASADPPSAWRVG